MMESIKKLREMTGAGMMDVKKALADAEGNEDKAIALLRERGIAKAVKKGDREAKEGIVRFAVDGNRAAMVEVNSETDFVARNADFQATVEKLAQAALQAKTNDVEEFKNFTVDGETVGNMVAATAGKIGENIVLNRVAYLEGQQVAGYVHSNGKIGVLVDLAGGDEAKAKDVALHVAAERPQFLTRDEVESGDIEKEREILTNKALAEGKPQQIVEKIVEGQIGKFYQERVLPEQTFVKDNSLTVAKYLGDASVNKFVRFEIGA
ncbi:translation elongation factor Ts [Deinococcus radiodurans]|jgi:translation elongation factor Ts (EF-Ts)|uniref:Elongation factor Ts n=1 Tax=Deinococcus radiodurans (strain ATCC 13939 / DSM 20539 / JCM 16871 / CCUG 27074 / LMG 4051 / NBRC 15346 / NCIMB 9279 / VKM B-1422 / R1) TaxID=243230 RepID=EFTS_DEIRA|nr:translation elongation factor Ts [Deinococcus radiodurans]Q9RU80.1 RecName: Full=Elongation factor Ts; Short=EF-Ts [Deinococcus radiodurans R1 = ATCC 13939 = DSM 20539]AAF11079.1 elongation factor Ts [Deinococcus radiodurans R1 = ATCC 13939 = DSM 20539]ANC71361.1 elongation factor Ts [Deinococcus radiodurans R1 = ATCC 13939 = DSM 20539]QEM70956.1 elongation factor Ts [Deinococcus radiodurans]QIP29515.1 elongation factor Ts [Deinococcus radiodurans]QIP31796.1 elongation factor Ts [Deinococc